VKKTNQKENTKDSVGKSSFGRISLPKVIVLDDSPMQLTSIKNRLQSHYEIFPAQDAATLYRLLEKITPALIILDIIMPDTSGFQVLELLKMNVSYADIPVIILSGSSDKEKIDKGYALGAVEYIKKPFEDEYLIETIARHINPGKHQSEASILVIDDTPAVLQSIYSLLKDDYQVYTLPKPEKLTELLQMINPDLFLIDYKMPIMTGFELVPLIRSKPIHTHTPIIFMTNEGTISHVSEAVRLGAADFLVKPIDDELLKMKIASHLKPARRCAKSVIEPEE
jgi:PleD family two-component response regulator